MIDFPFDSKQLSLIPEGETTLTKSETVLVPRAKGSVRIEEKFSFELPSSHQKHGSHSHKNNFSGNQEQFSPPEVTRKVFLTFVKRIDK